MMTTIAVAENASAADKTPRATPAPDYQAPHLMMTYRELQEAAFDAGLPVRDVPAEAPTAPRYAADLLRQMRARRIAGTSFATVTLAKWGIVAADWVRNEISYLVFQSADGRGDRAAATALDGEFQKLMIWFARTWNNGHLKQPVVAAATRAMVCLLAGHGLRPESYRIWVTPL